MHSIRPRPSGTEHQIASNEMRIFSLTYPIVGRLRVLLSSLAFFVTFPLPFNVFIYFDIPNANSIANRNLFPSESPEKQRKAKPKYCFRLIRRREISRRNRRMVGTWLEWRVAGNVYTGAIWRARVTIHIMQICWAFNLFHLRVHNSAYSAFGDGWAAFFSSPQLFLFWFFR